jgi:hypothetical protein
VRTRQYYIVILFIFFLGIQQTVFAQPGFYIPKTGKIFFNGDTATIFSNVLNAGKLGLGKNAVVNFKGTSWENDPLSLITDESAGGEGVSGIGGIIRFLANDSLPQWLTGGYNAASRQGPAFSNLQIQNKYGVRLTNGTAKVRHGLQLREGLVYLENNMLVVGDGYPGTISGYDSAHYIVTGISPGSGLLIRENIRSQDGMITFPVGSRAHAYTPAAIRSKVNRGDDYYVTVFDSVKADLFTGINEADSSANKTWQIGKRFHPNEDVADIYLQHLTADEGSYFTENRNFAFVAQFVNNSWDTGAPQFNPIPGILTTGGSLLNSGVNSRTFAGTLSNTSYFTKLTARPKTWVWLSAYRTDYLHVRVYWTTKPEVNNNYFVVQRRFSNQAVFTNIDTVKSKAVNGLSLNYLNYEMMDNNSYNGLTYYRLMLISYSGDTTYSNTVVIGYTPGGNQLVIWPNPSPGRFFVGITGAAAVKTIVIWNVLGQKLREEEVNYRSIIEMHMYLPGTYFVGFISYSGQLIDTKKLVIEGH